MAVEPASQASAKVGNILPEEKRASGGGKTSVSDLAQEGGSSVVGVG